jgi:uncharacterized protein (TIGR03083 family)
MALEDLDPFAIFDAEVERLDRYFSALADPVWLRPSRCAGWTVRDVLAHLAGEETYNQSCFHNDPGGLPARVRHEQAMADFNDWSVRTRRDRPVADVLAEWRTKNAATRRRMRTLGRDAALPTTDGPYPVGLQVFYYAAEYATHADDVGVPDPAAPARVRWRARVAAFALDEQGAKVEVVETGDGDYVVRAGAAWATLTPSEFVAAATGRLALTHTLDPDLRAGLRCLA